MRRRIDSGARRRTLTLSGGGPASAVFGPRLTSTGTLKSCTVRPSPVTATQTAKASPSDRSFRCQRLVSLSNIAGLGGGRVTAEAPAPLAAPSEGGLEAPGQL